MSQCLIVAIRDTATQSFASPVGVPHAAVAIRSFQQEANNPDSQVCKHAAEFELWMIGEMDMETGVLSGVPARLARAVELQRKEG